MKKLLIPFAVILLLGGYQKTVAAADTHRWTTYTSPDGVYQQCYPADLLQPKAGAGPDLTLTGTHHETAEISRPGGSVQDAMRSESDWFNQGGGKITYASKGANWFVFSGIDTEGQFTEAGGHGV